MQKLQDGRPLDLAVESISWPLGYPWMLPSCCRFLGFVIGEIFACFHMFPVSFMKSRFEPNISKERRSSAQGAMRKTSDFQVRGFCMFPRHLQSFRRYCHRRFPSDWRRCSSQEFGVPEESDWWFHWWILCAGHGAMFSGPHCAGHVSCIVLLYPPWKHWLNL